MSEVSRFFNSVGGDRRYLAEDWAAYFASFIGNGVFPRPSNGLQVMAGTGTQVIIRPGKAWINGYFYVNEEELRLPLPMAHGVLRRIDRIVIRWDLVERRIFIRVNSSAPASNPVPLPLQRDGDAYELCIADVMVNAGQLNITQANITDQRWNTVLCGVVVGVITQIDPSFITAQFTAFFNEHRAMIETDYVEWVTRITTLYSTYRQLVLEGYAEFSQSMESHFELFRSNTIAQFDLYIALLNGFRGDSQAAFEASLIWLNNFQAQGTNDFNTWFNTIKGLLDEDTAGHLLLLIQELQTFAPTEVIGTVDHNLGHYPLCTLHRAERAAGIGGAGEGGAGGGNIITIPAEFEIDGYDRVTVITTAQYARYTDIYKISDTMYGFADPAASNDLTTLFLTLR